MNNYLIYFDVNGIQRLVNLTDIDKKATWAVLKGNTPEVKTELYSVILHAHSNKINNPEIWKFSSDYDLAILQDYILNNLTETINIIRDYGERIL